VCAGQSYTAFAAFRSAQVSNMRSCTAQLCVLWVSNSGDTPGGYCSGNVALTNSYQTVTGTYPLNPNADARTGATVNVFVSCQVADYSLPATAIVHVDDVTLVNQAVAGVPVPVPNPAPTTSCSSVSIASVMPMPSPTSGSCTGGSPGVSSFGIVSDAQLVVGRIQGYISDTQTALQNDQAGLSTATDCNLGLLELAIGFEQSKVAIFQDILTFAQVVLSDAEALG
jgi:hypothetical protein